MTETIEFFDDHGKLKRNVLAEHILGKFIIKTLEDTDEILFFNRREGIYEKAEPSLKSYITLAVENEEDEITTHNINEIFEYIRRKTYTKRENFNKKDKIVLKNGILQLNPKLEIKEHSPNHLATFRIPVKYDPEANCPKIKKFVAEIVGEEDIAVIQEMVGYCLLKEYPFAKAFMLIGEGANGKSTLLSLIERFLGKKNVATPSLQEICYNNFAKVELYGKMANIHSDLPPIKLTLTGNFKMLTGGDLIRGEEKHKQAFNFKNYAKLLYSANELPKTKDTSKAFFRRWIIIKFPNIFEGKNEDPNILEKITTEEELSGLLNWAIEGLKRIIKQVGFSKTQSREEIETEWILRTDSLRAFVDRFVKEDAEKFIIKKDFYSAYSTFCEDYNVPAEDPSVVGRKLPALKAKIKSFRPKINGKQKRAWKGITFVPTVKEYIRHIQDNSTLLSSIKNYNIKESIKDLDTTDIKKKKLSDWPKKKEKPKTRIQLVMSCYPENKPKRYFLIEQEAEKKGIDPLDFNAMHEELKKKGMVVNVKGEKWVKSQI